MKIGRMQRSVFLFTFCYQVLLSTGQETCVRNLSLLEEGRNCRKFCDTNSDCRSSSKQCLCDDVCGKSCYNPSAPCEALEPVENAVLEGERAYGNEVTYSCNDGYVLVGSSTRTCRSDKKWTGSAPYCKAVCSTPMRTSSSYPETSKDVYETGDVVTYSCRFGFILSGNPNITCTSDGWTEARYLCSKVNCKSPSEINNGYYEGDDFFFGGRVFYHCNVGYEINQRQNFISCSTNGKWQGVVPACNAKKCPVPIAPMHGTVIDAGVRLTYGNEIRYKCADGYKLVGNERGRCNENNNWGEAPTCVVDKDCDFEDFRRPVCGFTTSGMNFNRTFLKTGAHGRGVGAARGYVAKASFERSQTNAEAILSSPSISRNTQVCLRFYYRVSEFESGSDFYLSMTGSSQRLWSFNRLEPRNTWLGTDYSFPSSRNDLGVHFTAKSSRSSTTVELDDISFLENTPCRDECSIPDSCQNGGTCINRIDDYTCFCRHGYEGKDCSIRLDCLVPPAPTDGSVSPSSGNRVLLDGTITYSCDPGYFMKNQLSGTLKATCLRSGSWNRPTPVCEESRCIVPQTPAHGTLSRATGEKVPADRSVSFTCDEGYTMIGQPTIYCRRSGTWSNEFPECVERQCTDSGECHFPFVYKGRTYKACIESKIGLADWCSLTAEYDDEWDRCDKSCPSGWTGWGGWGSCSKSCGRGQQIKRRICQSPQGGAICEGEATESRECFTQPCLDGGVELTTVNNKIYRLYQEGLSHGDSAARCAQLPGRLATLKTEKIFDTLMNLLPRHGVYHIGLKELSGTWRYSDGSRVPLRGEQRFQRWASNQPETHNNRKSCGVVYTNPHRIWYNVNCQTIRHHFICEVDIDLCSSSPCRNGGTCRNTETSFVCDCVEPYSGDTCENVIRCDRPQVPASIEISGGSHDSYVQGTSISFECKNRNEFLTGNTDMTCTEHGTWNKNSPTSCSFDPCSSFPCKNGGTCHRSGRRYLCVCLGSAYGTNCENVNDPCSINPCDNDGTCKEDGNSYICECTPQWTGNLCREKVPICPPLVAPTNGSMYQASRLEIGRPGSLVGFECDTGFTLQGESFLRCLDSLEWNHQPPVCQAKGCRIFGPTIPAGIEIVDWHLFEYEIGATLQVRCEDRLQTLNNNPVLTCTPGNRWDPLIYNYKCS